MKSENAKQSSQSHRQHPYKPPPHPSPSTLITFRRQPQPHDEADHAHLHRDSLTALIVRRHALAPLLVVLCMWPKVLRNAIAICMVPSGKPPSQPPFDHQSTFQPRLTGSRIRTAFQDLQTSIALYSVSHRLTPLERP
ncbi:uncharacterized protein SPSK_08103 [Sporothrix schenckii 1099-18]|uniref:Uncharacterized protein n=1 Tax=Sporothrix schenckii 1099-18 TaxID=1397361 RepID=A0A0F2MKQ7_SPOSC|nr:uncharacterized protein SPSK_08103 [Sporothrix schenckii 1099-18]KJR88771.1 hypothetical protein SPSK_08103 [Sporothrix schenckii 1099-18]